MIFTDFCLSPFMFPSAIPDVFLRRMFPPTLPAIFLPRKTPFFSYIPYALNANSYLDVQDNQTNMRNSSAKFLTFAVGRCGDVQ